MLAAWLFATWSAVCWTFSFAAATSIVSCKTARLGFKGSRTGGVEAVDELVAHSTVNGLHAILGRLGHRLLRGERSGEMPSGYGSGGTGNDGGTTGQSLSEERHGGDGGGCDETGWVAFNVECQLMSLGRDGLKEEEN